MIIYFDFVGDVYATGGFGFVRRAIQRDTREFVAIKYLHEADNAEARQRFAREVRQLETLKHQRIIRVIAADVTGPAPCYAMPWMPQTLLDYCGKVTWAEVRYLIHLLADVLSYLHASGGFHRDLKPENVLVSPEKQCFLADFGLGNAPGCTRNFTNSVCGTPGYAAPELETLGASASSDMYSMGATLFQVITGVHPKQARSFDISNYLQGIPPEDVRRLIFALTMPKPDDRPTALLVKTCFPPAPVPAPLPPKQTVPAWVRAIAQVTQQQPRLPPPPPKPRGLQELLKDMAAKNPYRLPPPLPPPARNLVPPKLAGLPPLPPLLTDEQRRRRAMLQMLAGLGLICLLTSKS